MNRIKIVTDSNSGILQSEGQEMGVFVIPMPFTINGEEYLEEISISQDKFYEFLSSDAEVTTSQPSQYYLQELFEELLKDCDEVVYLPMSSGLSGTCANATKLAERFDGRVQVIDNKRISVTLKSAVCEALTLANSGKNGVQIKELLESQSNLTSIYITVGTLKYLKKGGRVTPAAAALASLLRIKPILYSNGDNFEKCAISLNLAQAKKKMIMQAKQDLETKFKDMYEQGCMSVAVAHTQNLVEAEKFKTEIEKDIPNVKVEYLDPLSLSVSCHIGAGALAIAVFPNNLK